MDKLRLILVGCLAIAAIVSAWENEEDSSLSEELAPPRLVRSADTRGRKESHRTNEFHGENCQFIDFAKARSSGVGCVDGTKMVVKNK